MGLHDELITDKIVVGLAALGAYAMEKDLTLEKAIDMGQDRQRRQLYSVITEIPESSESEGSDYSDNDSGYDPGKPSKINQSRDTEINSESEEEKNEEEEIDEEGEMREEIEGGLEKKRRRRWKVKSNDYEGHPPTFQGQNTVNVQTEEPIDMFYCPFPDGLLDIIFHQSNLYAMYKGKMNFALTKPELKVFLGINLMMTYIRYPRLRMYWSSNPGLRQHCIANAMTANHFEDIMRYLHFVDPNNEAGEDRFFRIRPVLDALQTTFLSAMDPEECQSIDEQIIPFKGKHSTKQYIPKKPKPWGFKVWVRAGASTGYMYEFELYQGASGGRGRVGDLGAAAEVVLRLCDKLKWKNHKVFFDHFFCSIPLLEKMKSEGIEATGTCRANRLMGAQAKLKSKETLDEEGRGPHQL
ncbi:hypothetical protein ACEWY4_013875 [Coilia grayii]|uniref:PiggyBac transposable element-derived protein domain-containing protein n=1 Tax=Coilia grayii TaxID=363190 RepID=A0ABD1JXM7_9TELE